MQIGKFYTPFGAYLSEFINGAALEFGETRANGFSIGYSAHELVQTSLMLYQGETDRYGGQRRGLNWAISLESQPTEELTLGVSYQSDVADSDERLLTERNRRYSRKIDAVGAFLDWRSRPYQFTAEIISALHASPDLKSDRNKPLAWDFELTHPLLLDSLSASWRLEGSRKLEDQPKLQWGVTLNLQMTDHVSVALKYLRGRYRRGLAGGDEQTYRHIETAAAQLTIEF